MALSLPDNTGNMRERLILEQVLAGNYTVDFVTIKSEYNGHVAEFDVFSDALKIEGVRVNVCATTQQQIADAVGCMPLTAKLADLMWLQREVTLPPFNRTFSQTTAAMKAHSADIDAALLKLGSPSGLIFTVGKLWILDNRLAQCASDTACNYGWHFVGDTFDGQAWEQTASHALDPISGKVVRLIQGRGYAHNRFHTDYSQILLLVNKTCRVDGVERLLIEVLQDPELAPLANHDGVLHVLRQPGVSPSKDTTIVLPKVTVTA